MENVVLTVHLLLALGLIGVVLLQRSEGGGLGMGGGGGGVVTGRAAASALSKVTWALAVAFIGTSITLTVLAARGTEDGSVLDRITDVPAAEQTAPEAPSGSDLLPPSADDSTPLVPRAAD